MCVRFVSREATVHAVNRVSFTMQPGEVMCIIGESGSGKSVTLRAMMRLLPPRKTVLTGAIHIAGHDMLTLTPPQLSDIRGTTVAMIFQEPMTALDPAYTVGRQIAETVVRHEGCSYHAAYKRALDLLELVKVPSATRRLAAYPHELSGGLRQRAMIAMALSCRPSLLLADEPTTALDATVQIQVLVLLRQLQEELGMGVIFVTHDLGVAAEIADTIAVMYAGRMVETGSVQAVLQSIRCTRIRQACCPPPLLVTSVVPVSRLSRVRRPTCAACPQGAASRHAVRMPSRPVPRRFPRHSISQRAAWPAACVCPRMVSRRQS